eukprot:TRINITY_DN81573_c0_g1_i1.p4 TRINITY_DN81573_c0_g1~~TRINITY_DN81573_c0_g1_i1.p4  ORF type:complete len:122 (+),score=28.60 TRINITY_DN81573_c0_g1_i1:42-407(+)
MMAPIKAVCYSQQHANAVTFKMAGGFSCGACLCCLACLALALAPVLSAVFMSLSKVRHDDLDWCMQTRRTCESELGDLEEKHERLVNGLKDKSKDAFKEARAACESNLGALEAEHKLVLEL